MKRLSLIVAGLLIALSAGMVQAVDSSTNDDDTYIPWTWDDVED